MAATTPAFPAFRRLLLYLAITGAAGVLKAEPPRADREWRCQPQGGQWLCQRSPRPLAVDEATSQTPPNTSPPTITDNTATSQFTWDWVPKAQLTDPSLCQTGCDGAYIAPPANWPDADRTPETSPLRVSATRSKLVNNVATLKGDVTVSQGNRRLTADQASLDRHRHTLVAEGHIIFREPNLLVTASRTKLDTETGLGEFEQAHFLQHDKSLRGTAATITRDSDSSLDLKQATVTRCPPDDEVWSMAAGRIDLDSSTGWGSARNARLNIDNVPVFYMPYMTFPIDQRRKTGFLWPSFGSSSSNGFEFTAPYYLNLAPNYDATIAPRHIEKRGTMMQLELRHLNSYGRWQLAGAWLQDELYQPGVDPQLAQEQGIPDRKNRWTGHISHQGGIGGLSTEIDYSKVSDKDFFRQLTTDNLDLKRSAYLLQQAQLAYNTGQWHTEALARQYQTIDPLLTKQYRLVPRLSIEHDPGAANFNIDWLLNTEFTRFEHDQSWNKGGTFTTGDRSYSEAGVSYPMRSAAGFVIPTVKLRSVRYNLNATASGAPETLSATTPLGTLDMGLIFERAGKHYSQTLEPRIYYFYSDYVPQADQPNFDTRELDFSYSQLFRDTRFAGHDRLDDANQLSVGVTSRFIENSEGLEVLTLNLGQIFYFNNRRVQVDATQPTNTPDSSVAGEIRYQPQNNLWLNNTVLWNPHSSQIDRGGLSIHYQSPGNSLYNFSYRFRREGIHTLDNHVRDLSQADASVVLPVTSRWNIYSRYRYDIDQHRAVDDLAGLRYEDCCWAVSLLYQRGISNEYLDESTGRPVVQRDHAFILEFQLKGLGSLGDKARSMLIENILGYKDLEQ